MTAGRKIAGGVCALLLACDLVFACGDSNSADDTSPLTDASIDGQAEDDGSIDSTSRDGPVASDAAPDGSTGLPATFFCMTTALLGDADVPSVPFAGLRLWDTSAVWPKLETDAGVYDFSALDAWLAEAKRLNVDVVFTFGRTPEWATSGSPDSGCTYGPACNLPPSDIASGDTILKNFTTALVNHSLASTTAHIKYYEIWNEPDLHGTWAGTPAQLVTMGKDIASIVHALDKTALVIGPSPSTGNQFGIHFLPDYYDAGGAPNQDIVGMHGYVYTGGVFSTVPEGIVDTIDQLKILMSANDAGNLPIFFTEGSWGGAPNNASMTDDEKVAYLARDYLYMWMNGIDRFLIGMHGTRRRSERSERRRRDTGRKRVRHSGELARRLDARCEQLHQRCKRDLDVHAHARQRFARADFVECERDAFRERACVVHALPTLDDATSHAIAANAVTLGAKPILVVP